MTELAPWIDYLFLDQNALQKQISMCACGIILGKESKQGTHTATMQLLSAFKKCGNRNGTGVPHHTPNGCLCQTAKPSTSLMSCAYPNIWDLKLYFVQYNFI